MCNILQLAFLLAMSKCLDSFNKYLLNPLPCAQKLGTQQFFEITSKNLCSRGGVRRRHKTSSSENQEMTGDKI